MSSRLYITLARDRCSSALLRSSSRSWRPLPTLRSLRPSFTPQSRRLADLAKPSKLASQPSGSPSATPTSPIIETIPKKLALPERLVIYHAGTGRVLFLAVLKLTTIALGAIFCAVLTPAYVSAEKPWWQSLGVALCGVTPLVFVAFTTGPFVTFIHIRLPTTARQSREAFQRFVRTLPPQTSLEITTLSVIAKPRVSYLSAGDLRPVARRMGLINYVRDTSAENAVRPWYRFRAVGEFGVHGTNRGVKEGWVWEELVKRLEKRAAQGASRTA